MLQVRVALVQANSICTQFGCWGVEFWKTEVKEEVLVGQVFITQPRHYVFTEVLPIRSSSSFTRYGFRISGWVSSPFTVAKARSLP